LLFFCPTLRIMPLVIEQERLAQLLYLLVQSGSGTCTNFFTRISSVALIVFPGSSVLMVEDQALIVARIERFQSIVALKRVSKYL
jgi:hypothetical protein